MQDKKQQQNHPWQVLWQGIPGAPGIKTYSTEVFGDEEADDEDGCEKFKDSHSIFTKLEFIQQNDHMGGT
ncbi:hypothetical protein Peur_045206 [Populus x canadensis]